MANHFVFRTAREAKLSPVQFDPDKLTQSRAWVAVTSVDEGGSMIAPHRHMPLIGEIGTVLHHISDVGAGGAPDLQPLVGGGGAAPFPHAAAG